MAFSTEFVMGAGGGVEEYPVSTSVAGNTPWTQVLTVTPAGRALVVITGVVGSVAGSHTVTLQIDGQISARLGNGPASHAVVVEGSATVEITYSYWSSDATFTGTIYVVPLP